MPLNAKDMGLEATIDELRRLLVERFQVANRPEMIKADEPIFSAGVGLSSMDGVELLTEIEKRFDVEINEFERWIEESPTVASFAEYIIQKISTSDEPSKDQQRANE